MQNGVNPLSSRIAETCNNVCFEALKGLCRYSDIRFKGCLNKEPLWTDRMAFAILLSLMCGSESSKPATLKILFVHNGNFNCAIVFWMCAIKFRKWCTHWRDGKNTLLSISSKQILSLKGFQGSLLSNLMFNIEKGTSYRQTNKWWWSESLNTKSVQKRITCVRLDGWAFYLFIHEIRIFNESNTVECLCLSIDFNLLFYFIMIIWIQ